MSEHTVTQEIERWIAQYGSERDALNVAIAKLHVAPSILQEQELIELRAHNVELRKILLDALIQSGCDGDLCLYEWHEKARAAIAKAKGESESLVTGDGKSE